MQRPDVASHHIFGGITSQRRLVRSVLLFYPLLLFLIRCIDQLWCIFTYTVTIKQMNLFFYPGWITGPPHIEPGEDAEWHRMIQITLTVATYWRKLFLELSRVLTVYNTTFFIQSFVFYTLHLEYCCNAWWHNIKFAV